MRLQLIAILLCTGLAGCVAAPVAAPPPPVPEPQAEAVPPRPTPRVVWQPGGWHWRDGSYLWVPGHYVTRLASYHHWIPGHWSPANVWVAGHWA